MNKDLNLVLAQHGLIKSADLGYAALAKTLPELITTGAKYKPKALLRSISKFFGGSDGGRVAGQAAYNKATKTTADAWKAMNPWAQRSIKYPAQIAAGYGLGMPFGLPGWLAFGVGNEKDKLTAGQQGAAMALEGVQRQLQQSRDAYAQSGILGRLAGGFTAAFNPDKIFNPIDSELSRYIEKLRGIKPKKTPEDGAPVSNLNN